MSGRSVVCSRKSGGSKGSNAVAQFFGYILRCSDTSLNVGHSCDLIQRVRLHNEGHGAIWTAKRRPVVLCYHEAYDTEPEAIARERQIKGWSHAKKQALIDGDLKQLKTLSRCRSQHGLPEINTIS